MRADTAEHMYRGRDARFRVIQLSGTLWPILYAAPPPPSRPFRSHRDRSSTQRAAFDRPAPAPAPSRLSDAVRCSEKASAALRACAR